MIEVKVTRNYQITIPQEIRTKLDINVGDKLILRIEGDRIVVEKKRGNIASLNVSIGKRITDEDVNRAVREAGKEVGSG
ncbi:AbrB/MazE/SpoVT family DNA-binding domain-containing protein [Metallosphaera javensis (ex Hofmann et al. 2022)]|uniref:AbrB/MazE/SpoVT family DNA-binding domain-containing protein n=1 Tax=Metallosphaera javensis (ex Hofmann et al. 2022) TaxID=99938 RepID=UPI001EDF2EA0|nr:AbrB/MazE/SpoVT family DNA-binding domain-containing protein [Metallosphaera javensis (ex Hofmann et al. 2022)]